MKEPLEANAIGMVRPLASETGPGPATADAAGRSGRAAGSPTSREVFAHVLSDPVKIPT